MSRRRSIQGLLVTAKEASTLPLPLRISWGTIIWQKVLNLYSPYFCKKYRQTDAIAYAWRFAAMGSFDVDVCVNKIVKMEDLQAQAEEEDYSIDPVFPGIQLLFEIFQNKGKGVADAVEYAALAFAAHQLYRQGVCPFDPIVPADYHFALTDPVYILARDLFGRIQSSSLSHVGPEAASELHLEMELKPLPRELLLSKQTTPPLHEVKHLHRLYLGDWKA